MPNAILAEAHEDLVKIADLLFPPRHDPTETCRLIRAFGGLVRHGLDGPRWHDVDSAALSAAHHKLSTAACTAHEGEPLDNPAELLTVVRAAIEAIRRADPTLGVKGHRGTGKQADTDNRPTLDARRQQIRVNKKWHDIASEPAFEMLTLLVKAKGGWVQGKTIRGMDTNRRPDKLVANMPKPVQAVIETHKQSGYRIRPALF